MSGFIIGTKRGQAQVFDAKGAVVPVTEIDTTECVLLRLKSVKSDGYDAAILAYGKKRTIGASVKGQFKKAGIEKSYKYIREIRLERVSSASVVENEGVKSLKLGTVVLQVGSYIKPSDMFKMGELVDATGISKGKGFQGVVKRHHFRGGPKTHGQSDRLRAPGSIGPATTPGRVFRGTRMAGQMGNRQSTVRNLSVVSFTDTSVIVSGVIPGSISGLVKIVARRESL